MENWKRFLTLTEQGFTSDTPYNPEDFDNYMEQSRIRIRTMKTDTGWFARVILQRPGQDLELGTGEAATEEKAKEIAISNSKK